MKKITSILTIVVLLLACQVMGQDATKTLIKGVIVDNAGVPLPGANVVEKGTSNGALTDFNGDFEVSVDKPEGILEITYLGFQTKEVTYSSSNANLGKIILTESSVGLEEVMVIASVAVDRKTPVAVSTVKAEEIELKLGTQEFPEVMKSTPGVYATKGGGGFGDGELTLRGFNSENVAVMINGVPVNDMENGRVFWSNWAGLSDVTSQSQIQRGLGASKVAVPSIGGTMNVVTKTTEIEKGGNVSMTGGNDGYRKYGFMLSTGLMDNGFAATIMGSHTVGNGFVDGTEFEGISYFANVSKQINEQHKLALTAFGAQQRHGQRQFRQSIQTFRDSDRGIKYNADWGIKNGEVVHIQDNFYHKPQISLNHYWTISDASKLSTAIYYSSGTGGGGAEGGDERNKLRATGEFSDYRIGPLGPIDIDRIVDENIANGANGSTAILRASRNDHTWYGGLTSFNSQLNDKFTLLLGADIRHYRGRHFREVTDLLGGQYFLDDSDVNNPNRATRVGDKIDYNNDGIVNWYGGFAQVEYDNNGFSAFLAANASNTGYKRVDFFNKLDADPAQETDWVNFFAFGAKGGANYNLDDYHSVFANVGYFERAPFFRAVWEDFDNDNTNEDAENQKIFSAEIGYKLRLDNFSANLNVYYTKWDDRTVADVRNRDVQQTDGTTVNETQTLNLLGVNAVHQGVEFDFEWRLLEKLKLTGMLSVGDWRWDNNATGTYFNENQVARETVDVFIEDVPVGGSAQTTSALGLAYDILETTSLYVDYTYADRLYGGFDPEDRQTADVADPWSAPDFGLFDATLSHKFTIGDFDATLIGRMNNVFNTEYINVVRDGEFGDSGTAAGAGVFYGFGRTFSIGAKFEF